jgi:hypothetical protein
MTQFERTAKSSWLANPPAGLPRGTAASDPPALRAERPPASKLP